MSDYYSLIAQEFQILKSKASESELTDGEIKLLEECHENLLICRISVGKRTL